MFWPPVIERELRVALHKRDLRSSRWQVALGAGGFSVLFLLLSLLDRSWGRSLHGWLFLLGLVFGVVRPAQTCIGLFAEERRNQTLELLYLTGMSAGELFFGKFLGGLLVASCGLLALVPFLALPFLSGGVSLELFWATAVALPMLLCFSVAVAVLASVLCSDDGAASVLAVGIVAVICLATPLPFELGKTLTGSAPFSPAWLWLSPAYGAWLVGLGFRAGGVAQFWPTAGLTCGWTGLCLAGAAWVLRRRWRGEALLAERDSWWEKLRRGPG